jgi:ribonuclease HII
MLKPFLDPDRLECGCDEAGRGCLAGPVFAAAVILPQGFDCPLLDDSKRLSENQRVRLRILIEKEALAWNVATCSNVEIDEMNILRASITAMHRAIDGLKTAPQHLLIDGNRFLPYPHIEHTCIVKGDSLYQSIAAASILAKTFRDDFMLTLHYQYPAYGWNRNKGYPTQQHREAIARHGISDCHRRSFNLQCHSLNFE